MESKDLVRAETESYINCDTMWPRASSHCCHCRGGCCTGRPKLSPLREEKPHSNLRNWRIYDNATTYVLNWNFISRLHNKLESRLRHWGLCRYAKLIYYIHAHTHTYSCIHTYTHLRLYVFYYYQDAYCLICPSFIVCRRYYNLLCAAKPLVLQNDDIYTLIAIYTCLAIYIRNWWI